LATQLVEFPRTALNKLGGLDGDALTHWQASGCLVIEEFMTVSECQVLKHAADRLVDEFEPNEAATIFSTRDARHAKSEYFETSGDKIRCFLEEDAVDDAGRLIVPKSQAINKIGHALHDLDPVFERFSYQPLLATLTKQLGLSDPLLLQSMLIFKQPSIGGEVTWHQDGTFLFTEPQSVIGFWFALEDATLENGCLWILPGQHDRGLRSRFMRQDGSLQMVDYPDARDFDESKAVPLEVPAGTLVVLHGSLPHYSAPNLSQKSRYAYTLHAISASAAYPESNWLQRGSHLPLRPWI